MKKILNQFFCLLILCVLITAITIPAYAAGVIDPSQDVEFTISYQTQNDGVPIQGAKFELYRVADVDAYARMTLTDDFSGYPIRLDDLDQAGWDVLATTLKGHVWADSLTPEVSGETGADGCMTCTLKPGLYLVIGYRRTIGEYTYSATPFLVFMPEENLEKNTWDYTITAYPKAAGENNPSDDPDDRLITRKVLKIWDDAGKESGRPKEITVQLMCDGKVYDTVVLNADNNWRYAWDNLEQDHDWLVTEKAVNGYTQAITQEGITFTVKNTVTPETPADPVRPSDPTLPQTGLLWWPVLPLVVVGLLLIVIGLFRRKGGERD